MCAGLSHLIVRRDGVERTSVDITVPCSIDSPAIDCASVAVALLQAPRQKRHTSSVANI